MSNSFGFFLKLTTFGESHGTAIGVVLDGCPSGLRLNKRDIQEQLNRRRPGHNDLVSSRSEFDQVSIISGLRDGITLGSPITLLVFNKDCKSEDYKAFKDLFRPSHSDYTYYVKYGEHSFLGGGRSSARETIGRVAAGTIAEKILSEFYGVQIVAWVSSIGNLISNHIDYSVVTRMDVDKNDVKCPDDGVAYEMIKLIRKVKKFNDSIGGVVTCVCRNVPVGWGEPVFEKLEAKLAQAMLSIPASKGFEIGSGFSSSMFRGSIHNDFFVNERGHIRTKTNNSGGVQGGISNGEHILFRVSFKPASSIGLPQQTVNFKGEPVILEIAGRHDPCVVYRAVPVVEAMAALVLGDLAMCYARFTNV